MTVKQFGQRQAQGKTGRSGRARHSNTAIMTWSIGKKILLGAMIALGALMPAHAVVEFHLSMQKLAVTSEYVVLCEELELTDQGAPYSNGVPREVQALCKPLRVFKGEFVPDQEFTVQYKEVVRRPLRRGSSTLDAEGRVVSVAPPVYFPKGRALLFLNRTERPGVYTVVGAKLIQHDEVFDLGEDQGSSEFRPQQQPENSELPECLKYGEAELVADFLKGMALLADPSVPPQFEVPLHESDPLARTPRAIQGSAIILGLIPALLIYAAYRAGRSWLSKTMWVRVSLAGFAVIAAVVLGVQAHAALTIWWQRPVRWEWIKTGMSADDLRCFVANSERVYDFQGEQSREAVMSKRVDWLHLRGAWNLRVRYDENRRIESATIRYRGNYRWFVPSTRLD